METETEFEVEVGEELLENEGDIADEASLLRFALAERESERAQLLAALRDSLLASEPEIAPELVTGETLTEMRASFEAARATVQRVRESVRKESATAVSAGSPGRWQAPPASALEKIRRGLERSRT